MLVCCDLWLNGGNVKLYTLRPVRQVTYLKSDYSIP
jgi:hypothetical protein